MKLLAALTLMGLLAFATGYGLAALAAGFRRPRPVRRDRRFTILEAV